MTTSKPPKPPFPTTTAHLIRLCLFQPTRRPVELRGERIDTPWGRVKLWGRLGQQHADVLEAICYEREKKADLEDGRIKLLVDPARVKKRADVTSGTQFRSILKELECAVIEIGAPAHLACSGHLIDHIEPATGGDGTRITRYNPLTMGARPLFRVELGKAFCKLVVGDIWIGYDPALVARLDRGIAQAIARHVLSHKSPPRGGWIMDRMIQTVAGDLNEIAVRHRRREMRESAERLREIGIIVEGDRIRYEARRATKARRRATKAWRRATKA
jgi:hypothetical protein